MVLVDERGTSSSCPRCRSSVPKPKGRNFSCIGCGLRAHRDIVGALNIAKRAPLGGTDVDPLGLAILHRRAGRHLPGRTRRDRRRVAMELHRREVDPWPAVVRPSDVIERPAGESLAVVHS